MKASDGNREEDQRKFFFSLLPNFSFFPSSFSSFIPDFFPAEFTAGEPLPWKEALPQCPSVRRMFAFCEQTSLTAKCCNSEDRGSTM